MHYFSSLSRKRKKKGKSLNEMKTPRETDGISAQVTVAKLCLKILRLTAKQMSSYKFSLSKGFYKWYPARIC